MAEYKRERLNLGKLVEIGWRDPTARREKDFDKIKQTPDLEDYLACRYTSGRIVTCKDGIVILESEESSDRDIDFTAIPIHSIFQIHTYTRDTRKQYNAVPPILRKYLK